MGRDRIRRGGITFDPVKPAWQIPAYRMQLAVRPGSAGVIAECVFAQRPRFQRAEKGALEGNRLPGDRMPDGSRSDSPRRARYVAKDMPVRRVEETAFQRQPRHKRHADVTEK
jgi:hypothetical protein